LVEREEGLSMTQMQLTLDDDEAARVASLAGERRERLGLVVVKGGSRRRRCFRKNLASARVGARETESRARGRVCASEERGGFA
jgi:hypothetical protein